MLCQKCNKNEANTYYSQVINGKKTEMYLCPQCAKEMSIGNFSFGGFGFGFPSLVRAAATERPVRSAARPSAIFHRLVASDAPTAIPSLKMNCATQSAGYTAT